MVVVVVEEETLQAVVVETLHVIVVEHYSW